MKISWTAATLAAPVFRRGGKNTFKVSGVRLPSPEAARRDAWLAFVRSIR